MHIDTRKAGMNRELYYHTHYTQWVCAYEMKAALTLSVIRYDGRADRSRMIGGSYRPIFISREYEVERRRAIVESREWRIVDCDEGRLEFVSGS